MGGRFTSESVADLEWNMQTLQKSVMDQYFPDTLAGVMCALHYSRYLIDTRCDIDEAEKITYRILAESPYQESLHSAHINLALISVKRKIY